MLFLRFEPNIGKQLLKRYHTNMKNGFLILLLLSSILFTAQKSHAQISSAPAYTFAAGLKFGGYENGISGKYFVSQNTAIEGLLGFRDKGVVITGLYEINQVAFNVPELNFYYGAGAHIGSIGNAYQRFGSNSGTFPNNQILLGVDGTIGLEYIIPNSPIVVSLDLNPRIELASGPFVDLAPGLGVKYVFK